MTALDRPPAGADDSRCSGVVQANLALVFTPPFITAMIQSNRAEAQSRPMPFLLWKTAEPRFSRSPNRDGTIQPCISTSPLERISMLTVCGSWNWVAWSSWRCHADSGIPSDCLCDSAEPGSPQASGSAKCDSDRVLGAPVLGFLR